MARQIPDDRLAQLIDAATRVFIEQGYRRTQMADVAAALGVAKGTLYLYVESKEALFDLVCRYADQPRAAPSDVSFPVRSPKAGETLRYVRDELGRHQGVPALTTALSRKRTDTVATEVATVVGELYDQLAANRRRIKLIDKSARDYPELAKLWFEGARAGFLELFADYLKARIARGLIGRVPDVAATARLVLETTVFWAVHRHFDSRPEEVPENLARETVVQFVVRALTNKETL
ncbi:TetR/AcrR family transcriptional regulator [Candidatus Binatia bacterium]|jgi:AcrR family transcriptional regulator|nr:TetR/AcrR family transcriptional regulator [Candidatus Binatia bacterium]